MLAACGPIDPGQPPIPLPSPTASPVPSPTATPSPSSSVPAPAPAGTVVGVNGTSDHARAVDATAVLGAPIVRLEYGIGSSPADADADFAQAASKGVEILPLLGFANRIPSEAEARNAAAWAERHGPDGSGPAAATHPIRWLEFGNETALSYQGTEQQGQAYGQGACAALEALGEFPVGLLVQVDDGSTGSGWVEQARSGCPTIYERAGGGTLHPYGPPGAPYGSDRGARRVDATLDQLAGAGVPADFPIAVTEDGISSDNGRNLNGNYEWPTDMTYAQAAEGIRAKYAVLSERLGGRLQSYLNFQVHDQRATGLTSERELLAP